MEQKEILALAMLGVLKEKDRIAELVKMGKPEAIEEEAVLNEKLKILARLRVLEDMR